MKTTKILSLIAFLFCFTLNLRAQSGTCGANLTWELVDSTLTITGYGAMDNSHPWSSYSSQIARISLPDGLTNICEYAFQSCPNLQTIAIPNSVTSVGYSAFAGCTSLKQVNIGNSVEIIGSNAFYNTAITSITIPLSVTSIEDYAFSHCQQLTEITIPGSVSTIGHQAFYECSALQKAVLAKGVKSIGSQAFYHCYKMTEVSLPSSLISIGSSAFSSCSALASVVIPEQITTIEGGTFSSCSSLKEVTLPNNLQTIGNSAFSGCGFTHIDIPNSVTTLEASVFSSCKYLTSITLPDNITIIPNSAFSYCEKLTSVTIPEGVITIEHGAFSNCNLLSISLPNSLQTIASGDYYSYAGVFEYNKNLTEVVIPNGVTKLGAYAFEGCTSLLKVTIPESITTIEVNTFNGCTALSQISFPEGLTTIGNSAFYGCSNLRSITIPNNVTSIDEYAFCNCSSLSQVTLSKRMSSIKVATFMNCNSLSSIILPESLTTIEGAAFYNCNLTHLSLPQSLQTIGNGVVTAGATSGDYHGAFEKNRNLTTITIPQSIRVLGSHAFEDCYTLSQVTLPEGLTTIGEQAFAYCSSLKTILLPKTVTSLNSAFTYSGLTEIEIPEGVAVLDNTFYECKNLRKVILPSSLTTIDAYSFYNCTSLTTIVLPQSVRFIGTSAFDGCTLLSQINLPQAITTIESSTFKNCSSLREITIPNKVTTIDRYIFEGCSSLTSVTLPNNITTIGDRAFGNCSSLASIILPTELTFIEYYAFQYCTSLRSITIPSKVNNLSSSIFNGCVSLSNVTMLPPTPPTIDRTFDGAPSTLKINILCGTKEAYMADANWAALTYPINEISSNILTVKSNDNRMGEAYIPTPNTCENDTAIIEALPREGYQFAAWHDGNTDNPRTILVTQDTTFTANFEPLTTYQLTVNYDPKQGHISGIGEYYPNEEATLTVTPLGGYRFKQWGDGNTDNPRTIVMIQDTTLEALFIMGDYCGDDILYTFLNDTLTLNGTGDMWNLSQYGWNMYADEVLTITLSEGITSLGTNAFMDLMFLPEVTIPATVKTIHKRAFENCRSLTSVTFAPNSQLQTIDHWAFYECINLKSLEIPEGVTTIGNGAFYGCAYLDSIVLPASMMSIADNGFAQCTKLSAMTVHAITPPAVDSKTFESVNRAIPVYVPFGTGATYRATPIWQEFDIREMGAESNDNKIFYTSSDGNIITPKTLISSFSTFGASIISNVYENGIGTITFDGSVTSIGQGAFEDCSSLISITIPNSIKLIDRLAFQGCKSLISMAIPDSVIEIGWMAFASCTSLTSITIPSEVAIIAPGAFVACESMISMSVDTGNIVYDSRNNCNAIILTDNNTLICGCQTTVIPDNITRIGEWAFSGSNLTSITIPHNVTSIGDLAFDGCWELSTIFVNAIDPPILGTDVFYQDPNNPKLWCYYPCGSRLYYEESDWKNQVDYLIEYCGENANEIRYTTSNGYIIEPYNKDVFGANFISSTYENGEGVITFDGPVTSIGELAFYGLPDLTSLLIPSDVTYIAPGAISYCSSLASLIVSSDNTTYDSRDNCNAIIDTRTNTIVVGCKNTIIPKSVTGIGWYAFDGCRELTSIIIPSQITYVGTCAFRYCSSLISIAVEDGNARYDSREDCNAIIETKSNTLVAGFQSTIIPNSVVRIEDYAFLGNSNLTSIAIPNSVTSIGSSAFSQCYDLDTVYCYATIPPSLNGSNTFQNYDATLYVPCEALDTYKADVIWGKFSNIQCLDAPTPSNPCEDIIELDWRNALPLSQLIHGWYKLYVGDIHANQADFTSTIINDLACPATITRAFYANCEDEEPLFEGSATYELGATQQAMTYADFANIVPAHVDYLYLNIASIVEDCEPTPPCEDVTTEMEVTACESYEWNGETYTQSGDYTRFFTTTNGCDSIVTLHLTINNSVTGEPETTTICYGETYTWNGYTYSTEGEYSIVLMNALGCDSIATLHLTVLPEAAVYSTTVTICEGETYIWRGMELSQGGSYTDVEQDPTTGCDIAIYTLRLIVIDCEPTPPCENVDTTEYATVCYGETYTWNGQSYSTTGEYTQTLSSVAGCDSIVTLYLTVLPETIIVEENVTINEEYLPYTWRNQQCYSTGTYTISTPFADYPYCDSVIYVLNLTVEAPNKCGDNLYWHYSNNTMTITGYGAMYDDPELLSYRTQGWYPSRVTHVSLSTEITHIGDVAFADCANLTNIDIPTSVTSIGDGAFSWTGLQSITIPASVTELGEQVFEACNDLHTILYEGNPIAINNQTVHPLIGCVHLDTVITPAALWHCTAADPALEARYGVPHKAHYIEVTDGELTDQAVKYIAQNATTLEILDLTNATNTTLPYGAWSNCYQLTQLYLPEVIETLPESMIEGGCHLLEIAIPATVTEIGNYAFEGCVNVWRMTVDAVIPPKVYENTFDGISRSISVQIPAGSEELYREAEYWREFFVETDAQQSPQKAQKILHEDQILILRNGKVYTTMGQLITNE